MIKAKVNKVTIRLLREDVADVDAAGIVVATDTNLTLEPELARRAGIEVTRATAAIGWCDIGSAAITDAGDLTADKIIYAAAPRWGEGSERGKLASVTWECLRLAEENELKVLALPTISTGALGYPLENCATTMLSQIIDFTFEDLKYLRIVLLCLPDALSFDAFRGEFARQIDDLRESGEAHV